MYQVLWDQEVYLGLQVLLEKEAQQENEDLKVHLDYQAYQEKKAHPVYLDLLANEDSPDKMDFRELPVGHIQKLNSGIYVLLFLEIN